MLIPEQSDNSISLGPLMKSVILLSRCKDASGFPPAEQTLDVYSLYWQVNEFFLPLSILWNGS